MVNTKFFVPLTSMTYAAFGLREHNRKLLSCLLFRE